jgi:hypothetical protein
MLVPQFWQLLGLVLAGLCFWCVLGLVVACVLGRVFSLNRWEDDA